MFIARTCLLLACLAAGGCSQIAGSKVAADGSERQELLGKMRQHPSLASGETRKGPDTALLPAPRGPSPGAAHHHHHGSHGGHGK